MTDNAPSNEQPLIITVDRDLCIGAASCAMLAAKTFALDEEGKAYVLDGPHDDEETILTAAESCPVRAILVARANGEQLFP